MIPSALAPAAIAASIKPKLAQLHKATDQLQSMFVESLVKEMRQDESDEFSDMAGSDVYSGMVNQTLADAISKNGDFGISNQMYKQLSKTAFQQAEGRALGLKSTPVPVVNPAQTQPK